MKADPVNGLASEEAHLEHRVLGVLLGEVEDRDREETDDEQGDDPATRDSPTARPGCTRRSRCPSTTAPKKKPAKSTLLSQGIHALGQRDRRDDEGQRAEDEVEPEDRAPRPDADQDAADDRTHRERQSRHRGPRTEGARPGLVIGIDVSDHRQRRGLRGRRADAHDDATDDELARVDRDRADDRSAAEDRHADQHQTLATEVVPERAEHQHQAREGQGVAADDPLQLRDVGVELRLDAREDRAGDRVVEEGQEEDGEQRGETEVCADAANDDVSHLQRLAFEHVRGVGVLDHAPLSLPVIPTSRPVKVVTWSVHSMLSNQMLGPMYGPAPPLRTPAVDVTPDRRVDGTTSTTPRRCPRYFLGAAKVILKTALSPPDGVAHAHGALLQVRRRGAALAVADGARCDLELRLRQYARRGDLHRGRQEDVTTGFALGVRLALGDVHLVLGLETGARDGDDLVVRQTR